MVDNFPKLFRPMQIEDFVLCSKDASSFTGPGGDIFHDSAIEAILEEVQANETDLSSARIAIQVYLENELRKDPDNVVFMRMSDLFRPIFQKVIEIEVKMYGQPKFMISNESGSAQAWRMDAAAETPITAVNLPQDILAETAKYGFTSIKAEDYVLPDPPPSVDDQRREFFKELPMDAGDETHEQRERAWDKRFQKETLFEFIDRALFICHFHDQVSPLVTKQLLEYCLKGELFGIKRDEEMHRYEEACIIPEPELVPGDFICTMANASKRAFFTLLTITAERSEAFVKFLWDNIEWLREEGAWPADIYEGDSDIDQVYPDDFVVNQSKELALKALVKMYGKHPIFDEDLMGFHIALKFLQLDSKDMLKHFYLCLNDMMAYYNERHFFGSESNCNTLKDYISELEPQEKEPTPEEIEQQNLDAQEQRATKYSTGVFID